ncbi:hypothetical protein Taro_056378 [Colocasia esculenta]|uniref:Uncharacterized protein n=1 Tax=Colocasia esculenta TaxID=4460 RepID=A0A843XTR1_COLES|nr:hypothetical protein [Colocasia esculenta]
MQLRWSRGRADAEVLLIWRQGVRRPDAVRLHAAGGIRAEVARVKAASRKREGAVRWSPSIYKRTRGPHLRKPWLEFFRIFSFPFSVISVYAEQRAGGSIFFYFSSFTFPVFRAVSCWVGGVRIVLFFCSSVRDLGVFESSEFYFCCCGEISFVFPSSVRSSVEGSGEAFFLSSGLVRAEA